MPWAKYRTGCANHLLASTPVNILTLCQSVQVTMQWIAHMSP